MDKATEIKREFIMSTATEIVQYLDDKYCLDVDKYHIAEIININMGFLFGVIQNLTEEVQNGKG